MQVLDYSAGYPPPAILFIRGYAVIRYIGFPDRLKCITGTEYAAMVAAGVPVALVYENTLTEWRGGHSAGQAGATRARAHATAIGFPRDRPIYMAIDQDVVTDAEYTTMVDYLRGAAGPLGGTALTGVYGEADVIDRARNDGVATWWWQTKAWSRGRLTVAHLTQNIGELLVGGVACDVNDANALDWGQHPAPAPITPTHRTTLAKENDMQLPPGVEMSVCLVPPGPGHQLVINVGWEPITISKIAFVGATLPTDVHWTGANFGPIQIDPDRPLILDLDSYPGTVSVEIDYTAESTNNLAVAGFMAKG